MDKSMNETTLTSFYQTSLRAKANQSIKTFQAPLLMNRYSTSIYLSALRNDQNTTLSTG